MADMELREKVLGKIHGDEFAYEDMSDYMTTACELCNEDAKIQGKTKGDNLTFQFYIEGGKDFFLRVDDGKFSWGEGRLDEPMMEIGMDTRTCAGVFSAKINANSAYINRDMSFKGSLKHGLKFRNIFKMINKALGI